MAMLLLENSIEDLRLISRRKEKILRRQSRSKYTKVELGSPEKFQGWHNKGIRRYNQLFKAVSEYRKRRESKDLEETLQQEYAVLCGKSGTGTGDGEEIDDDYDGDDNSTCTEAIDGFVGAEITSLAWNTKVSHILAAANGNGTTTIWDLRENKPWCELRCETSGSAVSCAQWNPSQGMHLSTSSADDRNPVIKLWDLRASMTMPLATTEGVYGGHEKGVLDMDWCPFDDSLLVSCGKDNKTILWDLLTFRPICDIPNDCYGGLSGNGSGGAEPLANYHTSTQQNIGDHNPSNIGGALNTSQQKRYDVKWSPVRRGLLSTCSIDRKVQAHSVLGIATKCGRPPKWMKPASGISFGFGNSVTSFASNHKVVTISSHVEKPDLKAAVEKFESSIADGDYASFSAKKQEYAINIGDTNEAKVWGFMQVVFDPNVRERLLYLLGFDRERIKDYATGYVEEKKTNEIDPSLFSSSTLPMSVGVERAVKEALLVGNFEAAVECCIRSGDLADALILASYGGAELWAKTQEQYFSSELQKCSFLPVVSAVIHNKVSLLLNVSWVFNFPKPKNKLSPIFYYTIYSLGILSPRPIQKSGMKHSQRFVRIVHKRNLSVCVRL